LEEEEVLSHQASSSFNSMLEEVGTGAAAILPSSSFKEDATHLAVHETCLAYL
jgi:hypothetical protein